ncbi:MAG: cellulose biosynthesis protein BcsS [Hyphomicrobiaceae bacterium]
MDRWACALVLASLALHAIPALAGDSVAKDTPPVAEVWSGTEVTENSWYAYSGLIYALGNDVLENGWRVRLEGGGGTYGYAGRLPLQPPATDDVWFQGTIASGEAAIGYQQRFGWVIAKAFIGASYVEHRIVPDDVFNEISGATFGALGVFELWADFDSRTWGALSARYDTAFATFATHASAGYRVLPDVSLGVEVGAFGNENLDAGRMGALFKWDTDYGELTAAAGLSGDYADPSTPYGRISWLVRF